MVARDSITTAAPPTAAASQTGLLAGRGATIRLLSLVAILAAVALAHAPTLNDPFAGDDHLVLGPVRAVGPWEHIWQAFTLRDNIPYWRPLVAPLYAFEVHSIGLHPAAYHVIVIGLHLLSVALLARIALRLTGRWDVALLGALLFGVNPAYAPNVAMISSTVELLSVPLYLGAVLLTLHAVAQPALGRAYWGALLCFILGLLTKESAASAAAVVAAIFLLLDPVPAGRLRRASLRAAPFLLLVPPYTVFAYLTDTEDPTGIARLMYYFDLHAGQNLWWMLARLTAPLRNGHGPDVTVAGHTGAALLTTAAVLIAVRGTPVTRLLLWWTFVAAAPLLFWRPDLMVDRFTYQAAIPFSVLLALGLVRLAAWRSRPALAAGLALAAVCAVLTTMQNRERTREALAYAAVTDALLALDVSDGSEVVIAGGPFEGPFHALYLDAVAATYFPHQRVELRWVSSPADAPPEAAVIHWQR